MTTSGPYTSALFGNVDVLLGAGGPYTATNYGK